MSGECTHLSVSAVACLKIQKFVRFFLLHFPGLISGECIPLSASAVA
jgi:hypothetical protein